MDLFAMQFLGRHALKTLFVVFSSFDHSLLSIFLSLQLSLYYWRRARPDTFSVNVLRRYCIFWYLLSWLDCCLYIAVRYIVYLSTMFIYLFVVVGFNIIFVDAGTKLPQRRCSCGGIHTWFNPKANELFERLQCYFEVVDAAYCRQR